MMNIEGRWTRRAVKNLKVGNIISPEYNWVARIWKIWPGERPNQVWMILDPEMAKEYLCEQVIRDEILGPHLFAPNQRPLFWDGPDSIVRAHEARRF